MPIATWTEKPGNNEDDIKFTHKENGVTVHYTPPCTAFVSLDSVVKEGDLETTRQRISEVLPDTSAVIVKTDTASVPYIEIDWSEMEYEWEDHRKEVESRILGVLAQ